MTQQHFDTIMALCLMWEQYCSGEWGHMFMSAGESALDVLDSYGLIKNETVCSGDIDWDKLEEIRKDVI